MAHSPSMAPSVCATRVKKLDAVCTAPVQATLDGQPLSTGGLTGTVSEVVRRVVTQKVAAIELDKNEGQLSRELRSGRLELRELDRLGPAFFAALGGALVDQFGASRKTRQQIARERIPELIDVILTAVEAS